MSTSRRILGLIALTAVASGCGDDGGAATPDAARGVDAAALPDGPALPPDAALSDAAPPDAFDPMPLDLRATGLYSDFDGQVLADGVREYHPQFALWSDGAAKRRFFKLPPGAQIDTADMNFWLFPTGTRLWKEFSVDGARIETRLLLKTGPAQSDWFMMAYAWNAEQTEALAVPLGVTDALGTNHDIPAQSLCAKCHERTPGIALGVSAIQLSHSDAGSLTLADLIADDALSAPPAGPFALPGDSVDVAALGYLHANCGNCHNQHSDVIDAVDMRLWLEVEQLATVEGTATYTTTVGVPAVLSVGGATARVEPGVSATSAVFIRMNQRGPVGMPPIGSELVDPDGLAGIQAWIDRLQP